MANQDDMKVGVLADLADIEQQGVRAGEAFKKGFNAGFGPGGLSGALLGNGMAPTQGTSQAPGNDVAGILTKILQSNDQGFGRLLEASGGGLGGGASTGGGATLSGKPGKPGDAGAGGAGGAGGPGPEQQRRDRSGVDWGGVMGGASRFPQQAYANAYSGGFYGTDVANFAAQATSSIPLVGQFLGVVSNTMQQRDEALRSSLGVFRGGGTESWRSFHDLMTNKTGGIDTAKQFGIDRSEAAQLQLLTARSGQSRVDASQSGAFGLQGIYGLGAQGINTQGTFMKGGGDAPQFAQVLALAIGTQLDRGRWGEAFESISKAAGRITTGNVDTQGTMGMMNFIGTMGDRFKGASQASESMTGMLQGMQGGGGGAVGNLAALQAAGLGQPGVSFTDAWMKVQRGAAEGGVGLRDVLKQYEQLPVVQAYLKSGKEGDLNTAVFVLSKLLPSYKPTDIEALLRSMSSKGYKSGDSFKVSDGITRTMGKVLTSGKLPSKEGDLIGRDVLKSMEWSEAAIGDSGKGQFSDWETPGGLPENMQDLESAGALRSEPPVVSVDRPGNPDASGMTDPKFLADHVKSDGQYGAKRKNTDFHTGMDVMPTIPGGVIHSPVDGIVIQVINGVSAKAGAPGKAVIIKSDNDGPMIGIFHINPASLKVGLTSRVKKGMVIGSFLKNGKGGFGPGKTPHAHIAVQPVGSTWRTPSKDNTINPDSAIDLEDVVTPSSGGGGGAGASDGPVTSPGDSRLIEGKSSVDVNIYVHDGRISVQKSKRPGDPNRMYGNKK